MKVTEARRIAYRITTEVRKRDAYAQNLVASEVDCAQLSREDKSFATRLIYGVVGSASTLDYVINRNLNSPSDIDATVRDALRISTYELLYLQKDTYAAVDQGVELVRACAPKAAGLANAVLRKISRDIESFPYGDPATSLEAYALLHGYPQWLACALADDLGEANARTLMAASDEPAPLYMAVNPFKTTDAAFCAEMTSIGALYAVAGATSDAASGPGAVAGATSDAASGPGAVAGATSDAASGPGAADTAARGATSDPTRAPQYNAQPVPHCYRMDNAAIALESEVFQRGDAIVTDASAQLAAWLVNPPSGAQVLEIGAGRGTKSFLIVANAKHRAGSVQLVANDLYEFKNRVAAERLQELGVRGVRHATGDALKDETFKGGGLPKRYSFVFVDAPCSNLGTLRRHPEQRTRLTPGDLASIGKLQLALLRAASKKVAMGGMLLYSTCSPLHAEDEAIIDAFLNSSEGTGFEIDSLVPEAKLAAIDERNVTARRALEPRVVPKAFERFITPEGFVRIIPEVNSFDGHFIARLVRVS